MEKPLLWYVCQVAWLTLLAFRYQLGRFRDLTFTIPPYHSLLSSFCYKLGRFRHRVLGICAVSSQSCLQPWQNLGRKGESQMLPIPLIPICAPSLPCPGRVEKENQPIFTDPNTPISDSANHAKLVGPQTLNWLCDIWHGTIVREFYIKENRPSHK